MVEEKVTYELRCKKFTFDWDIKKHINEMEAPKNWPFIYIVGNDKYIYIGESGNIIERNKNHFKESMCQELNYVYLITGKAFNASLTKDLEAFLIKYMAADQKFKLLNRQGGSRERNYGGRAENLPLFEKIWDLLSDEDMVNSSISTLENLNLFRYTPYRLLDKKQHRLMEKIIDRLASADKKNKSTVTVVRGRAGSGKSVVATYLMKLFADGKEHEFLSDKNYRHFYNMKDIASFKCAMVVPQNSFRSTIKSVFASTPNLQAKMVMSASEAAKGDYDLVIIDEGHRLKKDGSIAVNNHVKKNNKLFGYPEGTTELDWMIKRAKHTIIFYDSKQSIMPNDVLKEDFNKLIRDKNTKEFRLTSQFRCKGGNEYLDFIDKLLKTKRPGDKKLIKNYELVLFNQIADMYDAIKEKEREYKLCRMVAGYAWSWDSQKTNSEKDYDIEIQGLKFNWNSTRTDWINSKNAINEVGCVHTVGGYDLNYAGVILGKDIKYDPVKKVIYVDPNNYYDGNGKKGISGEKLKECIINIYSILMTRGIQGTYLFVCDDNLREYLSKYIDVR